MILKMKIISLISLALCSIFFSSCTEEKTFAHFTPEANQEKLEHNFKYFLKYRETVFLSDNFICLDSAKTEIPKQRFLEDLSTGNYFPLRLKFEEKYAYQLKSLSSERSKPVKKYFQNEAKRELFNRSFEQKKFPFFQLPGPDNKNYESSIVQGKPAVYKLWFIKCTACVKEFPYLNAMVDFYKDSNINFISLALDENTAIQQFLKSKKLNYLNLGSAHGIIRDSLKAQMYPTHIVVNKKGIITKVVNDRRALEHALRNKDYNKYL